MAPPSTRVAVTTPSYNVPRLRAVLLVLKTQGLANDTRGLYDLRGVQVKKVGNYWLKITGASCMQARGVPEEMRSGAGRWRLLAQRPGSIAPYYVQTTRSSCKSPTSVLVGFSMMELLTVADWIGVSRCSCSGGVAVVLVLLLGVRCFVSVRVRATFNPARHASNGCHF